MKIISELKSNQKPAESEKKKTKFQKPPADSGKALYFPLNCLKQI